MKAAIYIRVSTQEQIENYSIESQKERLRAFCLAKGWEIYDEYIDPGYSGSSMDRPDLTRLIKDLNKIDAVVVYKLDRLSRSQRDTLTLIEEHFLDNKVAFVSITETLDTSTPFGKAMIGILSVFAQLERETIYERMQMGRVKRLEKGLRINSGNYNPSGYNRTANGLEVNPEEAEHIQRVYDLYEKYHSLTVVQKELKLMGYNVWRFRRYNDILSNVLYIGKVKHGEYEFDGVHEAIIDPEQFKRVQVLKSRHKGKNAHKAKEALLSGKIKCGICGENYTNLIKYEKEVINGKKVTVAQYRYLTCRARRYPSEYPQKCFNKIWRSDKVEAQLTNELKGFIIDSEEAKDSERLEIDFDKQLKQLNQKMERLVKLYSESRIDPDLLDKQLTTLDTEKKELLNRKEEYENDNQVDYTKQDIREFVYDLDNAPFAERRAIVDELVESITFYNNEVEIAWRI